MKYFLDFIFLTIAACLLWVLWDATAGAILSQRVFGVVALGGVLVLADLLLHIMLDD